MYKNYRAEFEEAFALGSRTARAFFMSHHPTLGFASNPSDPQNPFPGNGGLISVLTPMYGTALFPPNVDVVLSGHNHVLEILSFSSGHPPQFITGNGGDWAGSHFSRLTDITKDNVGELGLAWEYDLGTARVQEATPVVIDGVMYTSGNLGRVYALNAATGAELWKFEPEVDMQVNRFTCCDQANRGVQVSGGKVFVGSLDGYLYALDAKTGAVVWKTGTIADRQRGYTVTGAPEIAGDLVVIGNAGAEMDVRGYVTAYNIADGSELFGSMTVLPGGERAQDGFAALAALDADRDGWITPRDPGFAQLQLWSDTDQDRRSSSSELSPLPAAKIDAIELAYQRVPRCEASGCELERARFTFHDAHGNARTGAVIDVHLRGF
jgi:hypothetical protein